MIPRTLQHLKRFAQQERVQAGSLIVTLLGDAIHPRGGTFWLGSLIQLLSDLSINERLIRTAIYRLVKDGWLTSEPIGRRTNYSLTSTGLSRIEQASQRIYAMHSPTWDGHWRMLVLSPDMQTKDKETLRKALQWQGFGVWQSQMFIHPVADLNEVMASLHDEGHGHLLSHIWPLTSQTLPTKRSLAHHQVVTVAWDLKELAKRYRAFVQTYEPLLKDWDPSTNDEPSRTQHAFLLRLLLIHDHRRLWLRDPLLPADLLPDAWPGETARRVCRKLYLQLREASEIHLNQHLHLADGNPTRSQKWFGQRFKKC